MFSKRQRHTAAAPPAPTGAVDAVEGFEEREEAAAVADEIANLVGKDTSGKGKGGPAAQRGSQTALMVLCVVAAIILFAPSPWDQHAGPLQSQASPSLRVEKMVSDCTRRLQVCQSQLTSCRQRQTCSDQILSACQRLSQLCASINGQAGQPLASPATQAQQLPQQQQQPVFTAVVPRQDIPIVPPQVARQQMPAANGPVLQGQRLPVVQQHPQASQRYAQPTSVQEPPKLKQPVTVQQQQQQQKALPQTLQVGSQQAAAGTCKGAGMATPGGSCLCPALSSGPRCGGAPLLPGTCDCESGETSPFEQKDHVSKLSKRELPQAFSGPAVLAKDNPLVKSGSLIKVHLPGKEPAWKRIGKISSKEASKWLPTSDPVGGRIYGSCAIVGNSGVMLLEEKGAEIDAHDFVMRFNGAPTKGLERFVGSKTTVRIVNHSWQDYRETGDEIVLSHLRGPHHLEDFKLRRQANGASEKWYLFSPEFSSYAAQTAYEVATYFNINLQAEGEQAWTPTGGWTGIVMAMNLCAKVDIYGFHISERHNVPYHYHNRCPQPFAHRDVAEWLMVQAFEKHRLIEFRDECLFECHASDEECQACKAKNPVPRPVYEAGKALWQKGPMPDYCAQRLDWLKKEEKAGRCTGLCGKFEKNTDWGKTP